MPFHREQYRSRHSPAELFELVADIEKYPEFLPWVSRARILKRKDKELTADLIIRFKSFSETFTSIVTLNHPENDEAACTVDVVLMEGPFDHLRNSWKFVPLPDGGTELFFEIDFKFSSVILEKLIGTMFNNAVKKMVAAFEQRADIIYPGG